MTNDPFSRPTPRQSNFASCQSFRGRLVLIEPTKIDHDVPKAKGSKETGDKITATVTVIDGRGPVEIFSNRVGTGRYLEGPVHSGVWFSQEQITDGLQTEAQPGVPRALHRMVLCRIDTLQPGQPQGQGNPWVMNDVSDDDRDVARKFLADRMVSGASPTPAASQAPTDNPFAS